jgi:hypothetical protein
MSSEPLNVILKHLSELSHLSIEGEKLLDEKRVCKTMDMEKVNHDLEVLKASLAHVRSLK